ncbi:hypothetical protein ABEB36_011982 [Hypothenemus hampei]|uniref:Uncharacterized protein n=1 Tax=Hypothenemus hampei TaxID=57062 RepID=A0ABD1E9Y2_HYPHA
MCKNSSSTLLCLVISLSIVHLTIQDLTDNKIDEENPLAGIAKEILKEKNMENIGSIMNSFIQSDGAKQLMDGVLQNLATNKDSSELLANIGNLLSNDNTVNAKQNKNENSNDMNPMDLLAGLGSLMQNGDGTQGNPMALIQGLGSLLTNNKNNENGNVAGSLLQGLGSLMASQSGKQEESPAGALLQSLGSLVSAAAAGNNQNGGADALVQGVGALLGATGKEGSGLNPELIGNLVNMFSGSSANGAEKSKREKRSKTGKSKKIKKAASQYKSLDLNGILNMASTFFNQENNVDGNGGGSSFMDYLPMIANTINSFTGPEAQERAEEHAGHSWALPPAIEKIHVYFDAFINSDMGKGVQKYIENQQILKAFQDETGKFNYEKFKELIENHSFRRHWIQKLTKKIVELLKLISDENIQKQYVGMSITFINSFLNSNGFPSNALIDTKHPVQSITNFANFATKKYLDADIDTKQYVEPVVNYIQDILKLAKKSLATEELTDKLTDTINLELIEPITRINRAYRFAKMEPSCDKQVFLIFNEILSRNNTSLDMCFVY